MCLPLQHSVGLHYAQTPVSSTTLTSTLANNEPLLSFREILETQSVTSGILIEICYPPTRLVYRPEAGG